MLKLNDVTKIYQTASKEKVTALSNVSLSIDKSGIVFMWDSQAVEKQHY